MVARFDVGLIKNVDNTAVRLNDGFCPVCGVIRKTNQAILRNGEVFTHHFIAAGSTEDLVADLQRCDFGANLINNADTFVTDNIGHGAWGIDAAIQPGVPAADAAGLCFDHDFMTFGFAYIIGHDVELHVFFDKDAICNHIQFLPDPLAVWIRHIA